MTKKLRIKYIARQEAIAVRNMLRATNIEPYLL